MGCDPNNNPCHNNGTCESKLDGYTCKCTRNYVGDHCETLKGDIDSPNDQITVAPVEQLTSASGGSAGVFIGIGVSVIASVAAFVGIVRYARKRTQARAAAAAATSQGSVGSSMFSIQSLDSMASVGSVADYSVASVNPRKPGVRWTASTS